MTASEASKMAAGTAYDVLRMMVENNPSAEVQFVSLLEVAAILYEMAGEYPEFDRERKFNEICSAIRAEYQQKTGTIRS